MADVVAARAAALGFVAQGEPVRFGVAQFDQRTSEPVVGLVSDGDQQVDVQAWAFAVDAVGDLRPEFGQGHSVQRGQPREVGDGDLVGCRPDGDRQAREHQVVTIRWGWLPARGVVARRRCAAVWAGAISSRDQLQQPGATHPSGAQRGLGRAPDSAGWSRPAATIGCARRTTAAPGLVRSAHSAARAAAGAAGAAARVPAASGTVRHGNR
jgi:hypothetical protein